jgi:hypothetical protein
VVRSLVFGEKSLVLTAINFRLTAGRSCSALVWV